MIFRSFECRCELASILLEFEDDGSGTAIAAAVQKVQEVVDSNKTAKMGARKGFVPLKSIYEVLRNAYAGRLEAFRDDDDDAVAGEPASDDIDDIEDDEGEFETLM